MARDIKKLNPQGLARRDKGLMSSLLPPPGYVFVSIDLSSGEPTVTGEFSKDKNYLYATVDGVGQPPEYRNGILMLDDIYLMTASVSPLARQEVWDKFHKASFDGKSFAEMWISDPDKVRSEFKHTRTMHKILCVSEDVLVAVKNMGYVPVPLVKCGDEIWDGDGWVVCGGVVEKGSQEVIEFANTHITADHLILTEEGWKSASTIKADRSIYRETGLGLQRPSHTWTDVWAMASRVVRSTDTWKVPVYLRRLWIRAGVEILRQLSRRKIYKVAGD